MKSPKQLYESLNGLWVNLNEKMLFLSDPRNDVELNLIKILKIVEEILNLIQETYSLNLEKPVNIFLKKDNSLKRIGKNSVIIIDTYMQLCTTESLKSFRLHWFKKFSEANINSPPFFLDKHTKEKYFLLHTSETKNFCSPEQFSILIEKLLKTDEIQLIKVIERLLNNPDSKQASILESTIIKNKNFIRKNRFIIFCTLAALRESFWLKYGTQIHRIKLKIIYQAAFEHEFKPDTVTDQKNLSWACCNYGNIMLEGTEEDYPDYKEAKDYLEKSDMIDAKIDLAHLYALGLGVKRDAKKSLQILTTPALKKLFISYILICKNLYFYKGYAKEVFDHLTNCFDQLDIEERKNFSCAGQKIINFSAGLLSLILFQASTTQDDIEFYKFQAISYLKEYYFSYIFDMNLNAASDQDQFTKFSQFFLDTQLDTPKRHHKNSINYDLKNILSVGDIPADYFEFFNDRRNFFITNHSQFVKMAFNPYLINTLNFLNQYLEYKVSVAEFDYAFDIISFMKRLQISPNQDQVGKIINNCNIIFIRSLPAITTKQHGNMIHTLVCIGIVNKKFFLRDIQLICEKFYEKIKTLIIKDFSLAVSLFLYDLALLHHQVNNEKREQDIFNLSAKIVNLILSSQLHWNPYDYHQLKLACFYFIHCQRVAAKDKAAFGTLLLSLDENLGGVSFDPVKFKISKFQNRVSLELTRYIPRVTQEYEVETKIMKKSFRKRVDNFLSGLVLECDGWKHLNFSYKEKKDAKDDGYEINSNPKTKLRNTMLSWCIGHSRILEIRAIDKQLPDIHQEDDLAIRLAWFRFIQLKLRPFYRLETFMFFIHLDNSLQEQESWRQTEKCPLLGFLTYPEIFSFFHEQKTSPDLMNKFFARRTDEYQLPAMKL